MSIVYLPLEAIKKQISSQQIALEEGRDTAYSFLPKKRKKKKDTAYSNRSHVGHAKANC